MKKKNWLFLLSMTLFAFSACSPKSGDLTDDTEDIRDLPKDMATVYFQMNTAALNIHPQARSGQVYDDIKNLRILAFRQNSNQYFYTGDVDKTNISYDGTAFTGNARIPVGTYRFIPIYGLPISANTDLSISNIDYSTPYSDQLMVTQLENGVLPALFLQKEDVSVKDYVLGTDSKQANPKVSLNLTRAVARLDIHFVQGQKNSGEGDYVEKAGAVFGKNTDLSSLTLELENLNPSVRLINGVLITENIKPVKVRLDVDLSKSRTDGTGAKTTYGKNTAGGKAYDYEAIAKEDFINGSAHIYGPFLFPHTDTSSQGSNLTLTLVSTPDEVTKQVYSRTIHIDNVPLSRNRITLVKIYSGGDDIFHTKTDFEIFINKAWEDHTEISGSVE